MKMNKGMTLVLFLLALCVAAVPLMAQQLTGDLVVKVVDPSKAVVSGAKVTITSQSLIRPVEGTTDSEGLFFARSLPSGSYKVAVEKSGFKQAVHDKVSVEVGKSYTIEMPMAMGVTSETIEVSADAVQIDTVKSESAQVYRGESLTTLPGGRNFADFAKLAPSVNNESTAGGLSVDGASGSENQFYVDGVTTSNIFNGKANMGVRTEIVQEMQVKTGGYEAEFGGAMGGVVSVVTKSGSNDFHGQGYYYYGGSGLDGCMLNFSGSNEGTAYNCHRVYIDPTDATQAADRTFNSDHYTNNELGVNLGGPIWKDKAWFFVNVNPSFNNITRNTMLDDGVAQDFRQKQTRRAGMAKIDIQPFQSLRLFLNYSQDTFRYKGGLPSYVTYNDPVSGHEVGVDSTTYNWAGEGYKYPAYAFGGGATWTVTPKILVDTRYGFNGNDLIQFLQPSAPTLLLRTSSSSVGWNSSMGDGYKPVGWFNQNPGSVYATTQDYEKKLSWTTTGSATFNFGGVHNFKAGYIWERWALDVASAHIYDYLRFNFGKTYSDLNGNVLSSSCQGPDGNTYNPCGYLEVRSPFGEIAKLHTDHNAFFFQDSWTIGRRLTINPGVRFESEEIPSFSTIPQYAHAAVKWSYGDKIAPRFGASFDLFGNGKAKIYGSWGRFYDQMKLTMAEGSFGGFKWHSQYYLLNSAAAQNWFNMGQPHAATDFSPNCTGSLTGGSTTCDPYPTGVAGDPGLQFVEDRDWRLPSFDTLDPAIKPMRMQNATVGTEWQLPANYIFSFQYVHKQLDRTIEDVGVLTPLGEQYYITNPGFGYSVSKFEAVGLPPTPKAKRNYNAAEFRIRKPFSKSWMADFSYTYSKLYGNYGGLASSDEDTSNGIGQGRTDPNVERYFDEWYLSYQANNGKLAYGPLNTDRPHQIKFNGTYQLPKNLPQLSVFYTAQSGAPITTIATVENSEMIMNGRGDLGRLPWYTQTDFSVKQVFKPFKSESKSIEFSVNVLNL
ncbi:MAG TPA: carboxypeptidase regulatory-like domain-containing protein, partial [Terriglobales bacterium]